MSIHKSGVETMGCGNMGAIAAGKPGRDKAANVMINNLERLSCRAQAIAENFAARLEPYIDTQPEETTECKKEPCGPIYPRYFSQVSEYQNKIDRALDVFEEILNRLEI